MSNIISCLPASTFIHTKVNINDDVSQEDLFLGLNILSDVAEDQIVGTDPFGLTGNQPCLIKRYTSFNQVASEFRENSDTYRAAFVAFNVNTGGNALYISNFPLSTMSVTDVSNRFEAIQRQSNNWGYVILAKRAFYNETVGNLATDTYSSFQLAIAQWVEDRREINCEPKSFIAQTDDHRALLASPYDGGFNENIIYDTFLAEYNYTMVFYHNTLSDITDVGNSGQVFRKVDGFTDTNKNVPVYSQDINSNPIYFEYLDVSFCVYNISKDLNQPNSGYTAKYQELDFVSTSIPKISQAHATHPELIIGQWDSVSFTDTTCAIATNTTGTLQGADTRTFMQILTGYLPRSQSITNNFGYLGDADASLESAQFGRYGNAYVCICGSSSVISGTMASGRFWDIIHVTDWINVEFQTTICNRFTSSNKIPINSEGISIISSDLIAVLNAAQISQLIDDDLAEAPAYTVSAPSINDVSSLDRKNRTIPCFNIAYRLPPALHSVCVNSEATIFSEA